MSSKDQVLGSHGTAPARSGDHAHRAAITMPAAERHVGFARLATGHLCGVLGLTVGRVADLRLAVDEACGQFLQGGAPWSGADARLQLRFAWEARALRITVRGPIPGRWPDREGLGWLVLESLVGDVRCEVGIGRDIGVLAFDEPLAREPSGDLLWPATP